MTKKIKLAVLITTASLLASCAKKDDGKTASDSEALAGNIVGGYKSSDTFQKKNGLVGLIIHSEDGDGLCTGTLISKRIVLTAAHCLEGGNPVTVIFTQDITTATMETTRNSVQTLIHDQFLSGMIDGKSAWNDIGLIKLDEDAPADMSFARLPSMLNRPLEALTPIIEAGYGRTEASRFPASETFGTLKQVAGIEVIKLIQDGKEMLLKEEDKGSCNGDSGGPAFTKSADGSLVQVGINSRGTSAESCIGVGVFTTVAPHLKWIRVNSAKLMAMPDPATTIKKDPLLIAQK